MGEQNKGQYYQLAYALIAVCHLPKRYSGDSHGSTFAPSDDVGSDSGPHNHPHTDVHLVSEGPKTHEQEIQT